MGVGDIYLLKMFQTYQGANLLNVFAYRESTAGVIGDAEGLRLAFNEDILSQWRLTVSDGVFITNLEAFRILLPSDFADGAPVNNQGARVISAFDLLPAWTTFSYRSNRAGAGTRRSFKRFSGLSEADVEGQSLASTFLSLLGVVELQTALGTEIKRGADSGYTQIQIASNWVLGFGVTENLVTSTWETATLTTQVSRKV